MQGILILDRGFGSKAFAIASHIKSRYLATQVGRPLQMSPHPDQARCCIAVSLIRFLKDLLDVLLDWCEPSFVAWYTESGAPEKCIISISTSSDFRISPLAVAFSASTTNWK
jgi:hypothetical protein